MQSLLKMRPFIIFANSIKQEKTVCFDGMSAPPQRNTRSVNVQLLSTFPFQRDFFFYFSLTLRVLVTTIDALQHFETG